MSEKAKRPGVTTARTENAVSAAESLDRLHGMELDNAALLATRAEAKRRDAEADLAEAKASLVRVLRTGAVGLAVWVVLETALSAFKAYEAVSAAGVLA